MAKYIECDAVIEIAMQYCPDDDGVCSKADADLREMLDEIEAIPAADVAPVRHGHKVTHNRPIFVINQKIQGGKESICKFCVHRFVCRAYNNQPCIECNHFMSVVRCGECEYRKDARVNEKGFLICPASGMEITDNEYCSFGGREET